MLRHRRTRTTTLTRPGIASSAVPPIPWGRPSPLLCSTVRRGRCQLRDTVPPTLVRLTRRALEGGPAEPSNTPSVTTQGYVVTSGRRERSSPSLSTLCGHPYHCSATPGTVTTSPMLLEYTGTRRRHDHHCAAYGPTVDGTLEPARDGGQTTNHYAATLEAAPVRAQDAPRRLDWSRIRQDGRQLRGTARHASTRRKIVRRACKLLPP
jgi:hypothetical protein